MPPFAKRIAALVAVIVLPLMLSACGINDIPTKEEAAKAKWGDVQSQYQRRLDLVPNLVATVKGYAIQERTVLNEVVSARARATQVNLNGDRPPTAAQLQQFQAGQDGLSGALSRLLVTVEAYPDLKSNQNFLDLQHQLEGTENRIAVARQDYNEAVRAYNTSLRTIPSSWWKFMYPESKPMPLFAGNAAAQSAPTVDFGAPNPGQPMPDAGSAPGAEPPPPPSAPQAAPAPAQ